jgi:Flp pilus assembly protein TadD
LSKTLSLAMAAALCCAFTQSTKNGSVAFLIFPFEDQSQSAALAWAGEGVALSIGSQLRGPGVRVYEREETLNFLEGADLPPHAALSRGSMIYVGEQIGADKLVMGSYSGTENGLRIELRVLDVQSLKLGGEVVANGPLSALAQMENELAWIVLTNAGLTGSWTREAFTKQMRTIPNSAYSFFVRALNQSDQREQVKMLLKTVELCPAFGEARYRLGRYYFDQGKCRESVQQLEHADLKDPGSSELQFMLGTCYLNESELPGAIRAYSSLLSFRRSPEVLNNLGVAFLRNDDYALAERNLVEAMELDKTDLTIHWNLAIVRYLQGNLPAARALLEESLKSHPSWGMIHCLLSLVVKAQGEVESSAVEREQARRLGVECEKLESESPRNWARIFSSWSRASIR